MGGAPAATISLVPPLIAYKASARFIRASVSTLCVSRLLTQQHNTTMPQLFTCLVLAICLSCVRAACAPPAWWQFGEYMKDQASKYGIWTSIPCEKFNLPQTQHDICANPPNRELIIRLAVAVNVAEQACTQTFAGRRWRCHYTGGRDVFGPIVRQGVKESSAIYALVSAMAMYTITRECAMEAIPRLCHCASTPKSISQDEWRKTVPAEILSRDENSAFSWGGCTENLDFGYKVSKRFLDLSHKDCSICNRSVHLRNEEVGRAIVKEGLKVNCKCHGPSSSCAVQTCWKEMKRWEEVSNDIKEKYDNPVKVTNCNLAPVPANKIPNLVCQNESPDLCVKNDAVGVEGTCNRKCSSTSTQPDSSCRILCCGRGYITVTKITTISCNPKLRRKPPIGIEWGTCYKLITEHFCRCHST